MQACRARALGPTPSLSAGRLVATNRADTRADGMATREPDPEAFAITQSGAGRIVTSRMRRSARRFAPMDGHAQSRRGRGRSAARGLVAGARPGRRPPGRCFHHRRRHRPRPCSSDGCSTRGHRAGSLVDACSFKKFIECRAHCWSPPTCRCASPRRW
jgi:hypothetical protein